jgi:hypothetical protein
MEIALVPAGLAMDLDPVPDDVPDSEDRKPDNHLDHDDFPFRLLVCGWMPVPPCGGVIFNGLEFGQGR